MDDVFVTLLESLFGFLIPCFSSSLFLNEAERVEIVLHVVFFQKYCFCFKKQCLF